MAKGVKELKRRITGISNIAQITSAMEMVATTKLKRLQERASASRPYADKIQEMVGMLAGMTGVADASPLMAVREVDKIGMILISGDKGLCGSYNSNIFKALQAKMVALEEKDKSLFLFGKKGQIYARTKGLPVSYTYDGLLEKITYAGAKEVARDIRSRFIAGDVDEVHLVYTRFLSTVVQKPVVQKILPFAKEDLVSEETSEGLSEGESGGTGKNVDFLLEPSPEAVFEHLLPKFVEVKIYSALMESLASEYASRRVAMKAATDASNDMIKSLTKQYNRARQETITKELLEVVGGAEALRG